jgi:hypothetical protein
VVEAFVSHRRHIAEPGMDLIRDRKSGQEIRPASVSHLGCRQDPKARLALAYEREARLNLRATSASSSRSRFFVNTVGIGSTTDAKLGHRDGERHREAGRRPCNRARNRSNG